MHIGIICRRTCTCTNFVEFSTKAKHLVARSLKDENISSDEMQPFFGGITLLHVKIVVVFVVIVVEKLSFLLFYYYYLFFRRKQIFLHFDETPANL